MKTDASSFGSENEWTARLKKMLPVRADVVTGIGDDAAVVRSAGDDVDVVYTTDAVVESVHFLPDTAPRRIGHKMVGRLLSDLAAMGAEPDHILLNLVVGPDHSAQKLEDIYEGAEALAQTFGACIVGGDTMKGDALNLHGFASGHVPKGAAVLRSGAEVGDSIYVTGELGGSITGKHLDFIPRVKEGLWLREGGWATAMMDISDGIAQDLHRLCNQSGVGAVVSAGLVPISGSVAPGKNHDEQLRHALCDGEDYELLFTVSGRKADAFDEAWPVFSDIRCTRIGVIGIESEGVMLASADGKRMCLVGDAYDHLSDG